VTLSLAGVSKTYRLPHQMVLRAVQGLDLAVDRGEIVALLGAPGSGKTATLRMIAGLEPVTEGHITLAGRRIEALPPARRGIAMTFGESGLMPPLNVAQNIGLGQVDRPARRDKGAEERAVAELLEFAEALDLAPLLALRPAALTAGQKQRVALARTLMHHAALHLLDEPLGEQEPSLRAVLRARVRALVKQRRLTAVLVTHDQAEAHAMADRIAVIEAGVLQQIGTASDLRDRPANLFVGGCFGEPPMNTIAAVTSEGGLRLEDGTRITVPDTQLLPPGARVVLGVRPQHLMIGAPERLRLTVAANTWLGDQAQVALHYHGRLLVAVAQQRVAAPVGSAVSIGFADTDVHLFDAASGRALLHGGGRSGPVPHELAEAGWRSA
jgi:multiple sugar transport system ATP-binding protein